MTAPTVGPDLRPMFRGALSLEPLVIQNRHPELKADRLGDARTDPFRCKVMHLFGPRRTILYSSANVLGIYGAEQRC